MAIYRCGQRAVMKLRSGLLSKPKGELQREFRGTREAFGGLFFNC